MANKTSEYEIEEMIKLYKDGNSLSDISKIIGKSVSTIRKYLNKNGIKIKSSFDRLTDIEKIDICNLYLENKLNEIYDKYNFMNKNKVYSLASKMGVKKTSYFWSKIDEQLLIDNYGLPYSEIQQLLTSYHSIKAIAAKAIKMGLTNSQEWNNEEIQILKTFYSIIPKEEVQSMLPNRTINAIICKAMQLNIKSYNYINEKYSKEQKQFILDNCETMTDLEIAQELNKPLSGIQEQRRKLGIYYLNKDYSGYESFSKLFRGHIVNWKNESMKKCNYKCVLTGSKNYDIHHLYGFNTIVKETLNVLDKENKLYSKDINEYTKNELDYILSVSNNIHNKYPLGVCVDKNIHIMFHEIYGQGGNTEYQWNTFVDNYKNNKYNIHIAA